MNELLVERFMRYFASADPAQDVLGPGSSGPACYNIRMAMGHLDIPISPKWSEKTEYDQGLQEAVREFQSRYGHPIRDGLVGPGTRKFLTACLLTRLGPNAFRRLRNPNRDMPPQVFISYSSKDTAAVDKLDQWLRDHGISTIRYTHSFQAGGEIMERARSAIAISAKVLVVHTANSIKADWVRSEIAIAEELERQLNSSLIIYVRLDGEPLLEHDRHRIAIDAVGKPLGQLGKELLHAISGLQPDLPSFGYDEKEPLA